MKQQLEKNFKQIERCMKMQCDFCKRKEQCDEEENKERKE